MAKIYNQIGSLTHLLNKVKMHKIQGFETMDDIRAFRNNYKRSLQKIEESGCTLLKQEIAGLELRHKELSSDLDDGIENNKNLLKDELMKLDIFLTKKEDADNFLKKLFFFKKRKAVKRRDVLKYFFEEEVRKPFKKYFREIESLQSKIDDRKNNQERWVKKYTSDEVETLEYTLSVFKENRFLFYGAEGEEQALYALSKLPDTYAVINDYHLKFSTPIYDKRNDDRIFSIQIDHIVVGPTGVYLIETKNWSKYSVENRDLFSPVKQLRRHNFAIFVLLNQAIEEGEAKNLSGGWGERKISPKNIILLTGHKPPEEYQYVEIKSVSEVTNYISFKNNIFSENECDSVLTYLKHLSDVNR